MARQTKEQLEQENIKLEARCGMLQDMNTDLDYKCDWLITERRKLNRMIGRRTGIIIGILIGVAALAFMYHPIPVFW